MSSGIEAMLHGEGGLEKGPGHEMNEMCVNIQQLMHASFGIIGTV